MAAELQQSQDELLKWRDEFPILSQKTYLVSHSMGPMPKKAGVYLEQYANEWATEGVVGWEHWKDYPMQHGNMLATLINASKNTVMVQQNVSTLTGMLMSALVKPGNARKKIIATDLNFPSLLYVVQQYAAFGVELVLIKSPDGVGIPPELWEKALEEHGEQTLAVLVDHGIFRSGFLQDVKAITQLAHTKGAYAVIDVYQTGGCVPIDVVGWNADFVMGGSIKWLCGGPGTSWLYVKPALIESVCPQTTGWFAHARPFDFAMDMEFAADASRFHTGTPNIPGFYAARAGLEIINEVGVANIRAKSVQMTQMMAERAKDEGMTVKTPLDPSQRSGMICMDFDNAEAVHNALIARDIIVDYRPRCGLRVSPHFYNTAEEIGRFFDAMSELRKAL